MQKNEKQASADSGLLSMDLIPFQSVISKAAKRQHKTEKKLSWEESYKGMWSNTTFLSPWIFLINFTFFPFNFSV